MSDTSYPDEPRTQTVAPRAPRPAASPPLVPPEGSTFAGRFRIGRVLGEGGMGVVLEATHLHTGALLAIKLLTSSEDSSSAERLLREARAVGSLASPRIVQVVDAGRLDDGQAYLVLERLRGESLRQRLDREKMLPVQEAIAVVSQVCEALQVAHGAGVIHRDLKPSNLFLEEGPVLSVKVLDFGIAKLQREASPLTSTGEVFGSPGYMSPEQLRDAASVDARSDLWSLGVVLHELLTGQLPFSASSAAGLALAIGADDPAPLRSLRPEAPRALEALILRCLARNPARRFRSADELRQALGRPGSPSSSRWIWPGSLVTLAGALGLLVSWPGLAPRAPAAVPSASSPSAAERPVDAPASSLPAVVAEDASAPVSAVPAASSAAPSRPPRVGASRPPERRSLPPAPSPSPTPTSTLTPEQLATAHSH